MDGDDSNTKQEYEARAQKVRLGLKLWEADFAKSHGGRKPGRDDIKNNPSIAQKYKDYNKLRDIISGKAPAPPATTAGSKRAAGSSTKRKPDDPSPVETPLKRSKQFATPSKGQVPVDGNGFMLSPAVSRKLFSPAAITCLGPTPQRDGKVLGLFDLLVEKELGISPNKPAPQGIVRGGGRGGAGGAGQSTQATPRKGRGGRDDAPGVRLGQTPSSSRKRGIGTGTGTGSGTGTFATPHKKKDRAEPGTPSSVSRLNFDTPAFLKRQKLPTLDENAAFDAPAPLRLPRKPFARGLSEIITSLRKVEDEQADADLEALREAMSGDLELGASIPQKAQDTTAPTTDKAAAAAAQPDILKPDTDGPQLLGGFDDEGLYDSPVEDGQDGRSTRVYKKKGQKRTTRKVNIKPTRHKRPVEGGTAAAAAAAAAAEAEAEQEEGKAEDEEGEGDSGAEDGEESDPDFVEGDGDGAQEGDKARKPGKTQPAQKEKEGVVKKAARKVNELAHANFQRLKLRNHGAKGGPGHNSRFRRRR